MFWISTIGVVVVAISTIVAAWNAMIVRDQLDVMDSQQRPWMTISLVARDMRSSDSGSAELAVTQTLKNVGQMVATHINDEGVAITGSTSVELLNKIIQIQKEKCKSAEFLTEYGDMLFPNEENKTRQFLNYRNDNIGTKKSLEPLIIGCIAYQTYRGGPIHHTPYAFSVTRTKVDVMRAGNYRVETTTTGESFIWGQNVNGNRIEISRAFVGNTQAD
jgi:hypothetical protein